MTAEIAIMNREAVVLAADSAGSIGSKVYNTINKLFTLSKYHPVGIMFYGNSALIGVPWETIIKVYRSNLGKKKFDKLEDYANDFIKFLDGNKAFFPKEQQKIYFTSSTYLCFKELVDKIKKRSDQFRLIGIDNDKLRDYEESAYLNLSMDIVTREEEEKLKSYINAVCDKVPENIDEFNKYHDITIEIKDQLFNNLPSLTEEVSERLDRIAAYSYYKKNITGIVISGFGENDIFPSLVSYIITGVIENKLIIKKIENKCSTITFTKVAEILPFAQTQVMDNFLYGIDPKLRAVIRLVFSRVLEEYPEKTFNHFIKMLDKEISDKSLIEKIKKGYDDLKEEEKPQIDDLMKQFNEKSSDYNLKPIKDAVGVLPRDEMAAMAESLLNLTSLKQRVNLGDKESVGGSIDVAVISKVDGFVWIKRKHYFKPELNHQFFDRYFLEKGTLEKIKIALKKKI
ncbi:hypothetical protein [Methanobacterium sp. ACI-7]|uniref:hypothetical protein n=1 Tax=unclassified Methanobacterium TaxID=2627676 RepID=UPI0039C0A58E